VDVLDAGRWFYRLDGSATGQLATSQRLCELVRLLPKAELFYSPDGGAGHGWSGVMIFTMPLTKFQTATASALELTMTTIVVFSEGR